MKRFAFGFAAAVVLGLASLSAPASAATITKTNVVAPMTKVSAQPMTDVSSQRYVTRRTVIRRGPFCTVRKVVRRGPMGRRVVSTTRVCR